MVGTGLHSKNFWVIRKIGLKKYQKILVLTKAMFEGKMVGFGSLATNGYLDFLFTHKDFQRHGIAGNLLRKIEKKAKEQGNDLIYSDVSITAKGFFERHGYIVEKQQFKKSRNKELINFRMTKTINTAPGNGYL